MKETWKKMAPYLYTLLFIVVVLVVVSVLFTFSEVDEKGRAVAGGKQYKVKFSLLKLGKKKTA